VLALPGHLFALVEPDEQVQLLGKQRIVVLQVVAEQRKRFDERAAARHDFGPAPGEQVHVGKVLEHPHGIVGTEHGDGAGEPDGFGPDGRRRQHHRRRRDDEVGPVVLPDGKYVEPELVREFDLFQQVHHPFVRAAQLAGGRVRGVFYKGGYADFHVG
jgi:hypothetical protein